MQTVYRKLYPAYSVMLAVFGVFVLAALLLQSPAGIAEGLGKIIASRSVLITDYMQVGGVGAALVNAAIVGSFSVAMLYWNGVKPNGSIVMAMWLTAGFALFGKNLYNMLPITLGVMAYARARKEPFRNFSLVALLSATLSPVVSAITFINDSVFTYRGMAMGVAAGFACGFIFPAVSSFTHRMHGGYDLYNMGLAGGLISMFLDSALSSVGYSIESASIWSEGNNTPLAALLYVVSAILIGYGFRVAGPREALREYPKILASSGRLVSDYYITHSAACYLNMGVMCALSTTLMLGLGCDLNGPTLSGIFTIVGFSAFGKHVRNVVPLFIGSIISTRVNMWDPTMPSNTLAILFSSGLAPIAGQFGWAWGVVAGFLHVNTVIHIGSLNSGMNLYNNGFAAGFVALLLVPVIAELNKHSKDDDEL